MNDRKNVKGFVGRLGAFGWLLVGGGTLTVLVVGSLLWFLAGSSQQLEAEFAHIRLAGQPTSAAEMEDYYPYPPAESDMTGLWLSAVTPLEGVAFDTAAECLPIVSDGELEIPPPGQVWPELDATARLLKKYDLSMRQLHEAAERGGAARYPTDFHLGLDMPLDDRQLLRSGARLLALQCNVRAHQGDVAGAVQSIHAIFVMARSLESDPILISQLIRMALDGIALEQLERVLPAIDLSDEHFDGLQTDLRAIRYNEGLKRALVGEQAIGIASFQNPGFGDLSLTDRLIWQCTRQGDFALYLRTMSRIVAAAEKPWPQADQALEQNSLDLDNILNSGPRWARVRYHFTSTFLMAVGAAFTAAARHTARKDAADVAIGLERYRRRHGALPESLEQLVPEFLPKVPTDPFDGAPLRYVVRNTEYVVYSVGPDGNDDGGQDDQNGGPDVVFGPIPLPAAAGTDEP